MEDYISKEREIWEELEGQTVEVRIGTDWGSDEGFAVVTLHDLETGMFYVIDHYTVPRATEQEDSMSEVTFTQEQRDAIMQYWNEREWRPLWIPDANEFVDWLDDHTEKPLTFPCPGCGTPLEEMLRNIWECPNEQCPIFRIMASSSNTKAELSEALNS